MSLKPKLSFVSFDLVVHIPQGDLDKAQTPILLSRLPEAEELLLILNAVFALREQKACSSRFEAPRRQDTWEPSIFLALRRWIRLERRTLLQITRPGPRNCCAQHNLAWLTGRFQSVALSQGSGPCIWHSCGNHKMMPLKV